MTFQPNIIHILTHPLIVLIAAFYLLAMVLISILRHPLNFWKSDPNDAERSLLLTSEKLGTHHVIVSEGVRFHYVSRGSGPLMLLLHGFPDCWYVWDELMDLLAKQFHVIALDLKGFGGSDKPIAREEYALDRLVKELDGLVTILSPGKPIHLVGHDWGGLLAWAYARKHADKLSRLVIIDAPHPLAFKRASWGQLMKSYYFALFQVPYLNELLMLGDNATLIKKMYRRAKMTGSTAAYIEIMTSAFKLPGAATAGLNYYRNLRKLAREEGEESQSIVWTSSKIQVPTLVLWGRWDRALGVELTQSMTDFVEQVKVEILDDAGHWPMLDCPSLVYQQIKEFVTN